MKCRICKSATEEIFKGYILLKYNISYYQCSECSFIQTENPYWLEEAYSDAISSLDIGMVQRNMQLAPKVGKIIRKNLDIKGKFLDYGGGYGLFVRMMRDAGFDFYRQDIYCQNLFAQYFDIQDLKSETRFEALTAFEVFEHLIDPADELIKMLKLSDNIIFSTLLQPKKRFSNINEWWYFLPESGQHISFYSTESLEKLAAQFSCNFYTNGSNFHMITKNKFSTDIMCLYPEKKKNVFIRTLNRFKKKKKTQTFESFLQKDWDMIRHKIHKKS